MTEPRWFTVEHRDAVAIVTFRRPPRNLMSMAAMSELESVVESVAADPTVNVLVITGGVDGYFVAHADLDDLVALGEGRPAEGDPASWARTFERLEAMPQPVVAAINGQAWGGGSELALACTVRVAAASATLGQPEVVVGIPPGAGGTQRLPRLIGAGRAAELILSGRIVGTDEALRIGYVDAVLPDAGFPDAAIAWAARLAARPRDAVAAAKRAIVEGLRGSFADGLRLETALFLGCQTSAGTLDLQRAVAARYRAAGDDEHITLD
jgi:enoyl-CoA hydratase